MYVSIFRYIFKYTNVYFGKGEIMYTFFTHILSIIAYNFFSRALVNKLIKLHKHKHKIYIINAINCLKLRQIENLVLKSGANK